jgi:hypothetical protein
MYINTIHQYILKTLLKIPPTTLVLKYIRKFSNFLMSIILSQIHSICSKFSMFVGFLKKLTCLIKYIQNEQK